MDPTEVVNLRIDDDFDVYIGRIASAENHFGNPFTHLPNIRGTVWVDSRDTAIARYGRWLRGDPEFRTVEPARRQWILENMKFLRGKRLGCFCKPLSCHGDVLIEMMETQPDGC